MSELRQDPVTRDWVIVAPERMHRPKDAGRGETAPCPFCPGHEGAAPAAVDAIEDGRGRWRVRAVPNKYPVLGPADAEAGLERTPQGWRRRAGRGRHEVIVEAREHGATIATMPAAQVRLVLEMYLRRCRALGESLPGMRQVVLFRNHGPRAGTSLAHPHSQIVASPVVAPETRRRMAAEVAYFDMSRLAEQYLDLFAAFEPRFSMRTRSTIAASTSGAGAART